VAAIQQARYAAGLGRLLQLKDRDALGNAMEDLFPVVVLDDLRDPDLGFAMNRDSWQAAGVANANAAHLSAVALINGGSGIVVVESIDVSSDVSQGWEILITNSGGIPGLGAPLPFVQWKDVRNGTAGPPSVSVFSSITAEPASFPFVHQAVVGGQSMFTIRGPWVLLPTSTASGNDRYLVVRGANLNTAVRAMFRGYERPFEKGDDR
jgi:hypothetical protein